MIGVLGSGIGGLTVVRELIKQLPEYDLIYLGDTARAPYGDKSPETVTRWALRNTGFLLDKGATLLVTACNTISSIASETVSKRYDLPVFEVITPGVERALSYSKKLMIGVIGTRTTIESGIYEEKIKQMSPEAKVYSMACPLLVPLVEEGWIKKPETTMIIKKYLHPLKAKQVDTLILGSTHYVR
ncbi:MAG: glutamate racemase, partial [Desulfobacterales bacterium]|nr:glutamate racemase [Desulfobacterales bacterium]